MAVDIGPALGLTADSSSLVVATEELKDLSAAAKQAQASAQGLVGTTDKVAASAGKMAGATGDAAFQTGRLTPGMAASGGQARMLAQQLSQVAQQTSATGNFVQALAIQLPDMALGFGVVGIAAGILAGITLPLLAGAFGGASEETLRAEAAAIRLKDAWASLSQAGTDAQTQIDQLRFGVDEAYQVELMREQISLRDQINAKVREGQIYLANTTDSLDRQRIIAAEYQAEIDKLAGTYQANAAALDRQAERTATLAVMEGVRVQRANEIKAKQEQVAQATEKMKQLMESLAGVNISGPWQSVLGAIDNAIAKANQYRAAMENASPGNLARDGDDGRGGQGEQRRSAAIYNSKETMDRLFPTGGGGGGGGGGTDQRGTQLEALIESLRTERETVEVWRSEQLELLTMYSDTELQAIGGANEAKLRLEQEYQERIRGIRDGANGTALTDAASLFGSLASITEAGGGKLVKISAGLSAAQTIIAGYEAAMTAAAKAPTLAGKIAAYAFWIGQSAKAVAGIRSAAGGGGGGGGGGARGAMASAAAAPSSPVSVSIAGLNPGDLYSGSSVIGLVDAVQKELRNRGAIIQFV